MNSKEYLDKLDNMYKRYFNVYKNHTLLGYNLDIFAEYKVHNERYFLSKKAVIYSFENFEYCLAKSFEEVNEDQLEEFTKLLVKSTNEIIKPSTEHMSTYLTGILISEKGFSQDIIKKAEKFKYSKNFLFTLKGWCDVRLVLVDLEKSEVITNKKGREVRKNYIIGS